MAVEVDAAYAEAVQDKAEAYGAAIEVLDAQLLVIRRENVKDAARQVKLEQVREIEVVAEAERAVVRRADKFNFTDEQLRSYAE